jgi:hypothetical protein
MGRDLPLPADPHMKGAGGPMPDQPKPCSGRLRIRMRGEFSRQENSK